MAENFDLIFGQNASQQYAWNDADYQNGWGTIGNIPPTAAQFDALQRRSDTKLKELNDELTPLVNADTADSRQPSTTYSDGDIKYSSLLPTGWFLTCTAAGTTSASELVLPTPIAEGDTVTDGTVTWTIRKIGGAGDAGDGVPIGAILAYSANGELPSGYLLCDGSAVSRTMYPDLFSVIGTTYGAGDGSTTFNVPDANQAKRFLQGGVTAGQTKDAGLPNITGVAAGTGCNGGFLNWAASDGGAFSAADNTQDGFKSTPVTNGASNASLVLDASRSNPIYGASNTVQPPALTMRYIIKAFDGQTADSALIDITQYAQELAGKADRALDNLSAGGENHFLNNDFTIIYPNGGTKESPANITVKSRYVENNPFPGYYVICDTEILINNQWGSVSGFIFPDGGRGTKATQLNDNNIVLQTGGSAVTTSSVACGNPFAITDTIKTAPCRVKVWKIGKIPTA